MDEKRPLGTILVEKNLISKEQLREALDIQKNTGQPLGKILCVDLKYVTEADIEEALDMQSNTQEIDLKGIEIPSDVIALVTPATAKRYQIIPINKQANALLIAVSTGMNVNMLEEIKFIVGMDLKTKIAQDQDIRDALKRYYQLEKDEDEKQEDYDQILNETLGADVNLEQLANEAPVIRLVSYILNQAIKDRASDIHFESFEDVFKVRYRIDGVLYEMKALPPKLSLAVVSRIKVMAGMDIAERRLPQDGRIDLSMADSKKDVDLRVSTLPTIFGENIVMRVLDRSNVALSLDEIGLYKEDEDKIKKMIKFPNGIILTTGPTGCGKTTTLYSMLKELNSIESKLITTEDPVEYDLDGVIQVATKPKIGLNFVKCLRHILRQDPDIIMVGEIRDRETAQMAIQSALTGHLVLSSLHTNDAPSTITRLLDMGIEPFLITSTLNSVIAQRLLRTLCPKCKQEMIPNQKMLERVNLNSEEVKTKKFYMGKGCEFCNHTGYKGRIGIFEILILDDEIKQCIIDRASTADIRNIAKKNGMKLLREDSLKKVLEGLTSLEEVIKETN